MFTSSRPVLAAAMLLASLLPSTPAFSQSRGGFQAAPAEVSPERLQSPGGRQQLPAVNQLRQQFNQGCIGQRNTPQQAGYCGCAFDSLLRRYTVQQYVAMDALIVRGGPAVGRFAGIAWDPEFTACRRRFPAQGR